MHNTVRTFTTTPTAATTTNTHIPLSLALIARIRGHYSGLGRSSVVVTNKCTSEYSIAGANNTLDFVSLEFLF